jgi:hypothetical protein
MIRPKDHASRTLTLALLPVGILLLWNACQLARLQRPMKIGAEAWIGRQIGRTARNHLVLGLATTKGTNVAAIRDDGSLEIHRSYAPLASWTVALLMAAGLSFDHAVRIPVLLWLNAFLVALWSFARDRWGDRVAAFALLFAASCPILLFKHGITCIFEILALGPLMVAVALFARPARGPGIWTGLVVMSVAAVMYSWICWLVIIPCAVREAWKGHRAGAVGVGVSAVAVPILVHFTTMALASGDPCGDVANFFFHIGERASNLDRQGRPITYAMVWRLLINRWVKDIGSISLVCTAACLASAVVPRRRVGGWPWIALLFAFALPLNLARNIALHDFFAILFVPVAALSAGLVVGTAVSRPRGVPAQALAIGLVLAVLLGVDVLPKRRMMTLTPDSYRQATIADEIGRVIRKDDFVIVNPEVVGRRPTDSIVPDASREMSPRPYYCGQMSQTVFVAYGGLDATRLAARARPGQRVVVLEVGDRIWDLPRHFSRLRTRSKQLLVGVGLNLLARSG